MEDICERNLTRTSNKYMYMYIYRCTCYVSTPADDVTAPGTTKESQQHGVPHARTGCSITRRASDTVTRHRLRAQAGPETRSSTPTVEHGATLIDSTGNTLIGSTCLIDVYEKHAMLEQACVQLNSTSLNSIFHLATLRICGSNRFKRRRSTEIFSQIFHN